MIYSVKQFLSAVVVRVAFDVQISPRGIYTSGKGATGMFSMSFSLSLCM